jgi:hypothetical protein
LGGFNLIRRPENRNKPGGDPNLMLAFNEAISKLGIIELPLSGQQFTWTTRQQNPLLERLNCFFIFKSWSLEFPTSMVTTLSRDTSDHVPCAISIKTEVPKSQIFRFENFWLEQEEKAAYTSCCPKALGLEQEKETYALCCPRALGLETLSLEKAAFSPCSLGALSLKQEKAAYTPCCPGALGLKALSLGVERFE